MNIAIIIDRIFSLIYLLLIIEVFLTWIPNIKWYSEPFKTLKSFSELFFAPARKIIPPIGMIDISPIIVFILLGVLRNLLIGIFRAF